MGKTIASVHWVSRCLAAGRIVPVGLFEPKDFRGELGPQRSRIYFTNGLGQQLFKVRFMISVFSYSYPYLGM